MAVSISRGSLSTTSPVKYLILFLFPVILSAQQTEVSLWVPEGWKNCTIEINGSPVFFNESSTISNKRFYTDQGGQIITVKSGDKACEMVRNVVSTNGVYSPSFFCDRTYKLNQMQESFDFSNLTPEQWVEALNSLGDAAMSLGVKQIHDAVEASDSEDSKIALQYFINTHAVVSGKDEMTKEDYLKYFRNHYSNIFK